MARAPSTVTRPPAARDGVSRRRGSLSVFCLTAGPGPRVAALLDSLRPAADEIIVALDERADREVQDDLATVADRIMVYPYAEPVDRPLPWLFDQCRGDWAFTVDDDEIPSLALLEALPELCSDEGVTHYWLPRRWLFPDASTYLDESPWRPDYQLRLVRRDPRFIRFSDEFHRPVLADGPGRFPQLPLWHVDPLLRSFEQRLEKARRYERLRPGMRIGGRALNFAFYVPELRPEPLLAPLPPPERAHVEAVLGAERPTGVARAEVSRVTRAEIDARWPATAPEVQDGRLELLERPRDLAAGEQRTLDVLVHNTGGAEWPWGREGVPAVRLESSWLTATGERVEGCELRTLLPAALPAGESDAVPVHVLAPERPGPYRIDLRLVQESAGSFGGGTSCEVVVRPRRLIAILGDDAAVAEVARLIEAVPELEPVVVGGRVPGQAGYAPAPGLRPYLMADVPAARPAFAATVVGRTARFGAAAAAARLGRPPRLPRGGDAFLAAARDWELLVVAGLDGPPEVRELWRAAATVRAAAALGVRVAVRRGAVPADGRAARALSSAVTSGAAVVFDDPAELLPLLSRPG